VKISVKSPTNGIDYPFLLYQKLFSPFEATELIEKKNNPLPFFMTTMTQQQNASPFPSRHLEVHLVTGRSFTAGVRR